MNLICFGEFCAAKSTLLSQHKLVQVCCLTFEQLPANLELMVLLLQIPFFELSTMVREKVGRTKQFLLCLKAFSLAGQSISL